ncbi:hypothetical protein PR048_024852 [Dryococelus australis]|uniref:Uncharacterized protein n=1 Tax=Dryococelus australis TaxID=614101 RepID=A0ABQ9GPT2_9NEOP|nr:hypothetical protein PR048_024852 [Dryococelus australis]
MVNSGNYFFSVVAYFTGRGTFSVPVRICTGSSSDICQRGRRLAYSPSTKAIWVQSPAGSLRIFACGIRAGRCRWSAGFLGDLPFPRATTFRHCSILTSITLIGSQDINVKNRPNFFTRSLIFQRLISKVLTLLRQRLGTAEDWRNGTPPPFSQNPNLAHQQMPITRVSGQRDKLSTRDNIVRRKTSRANSLAAHNQSLYPNIVLC